MAEESPEDAAKQEAEAALIAEEEAELSKLQVKKDIGSKLTKKQQERYRVLTENAKARAEAAVAAAEPMHGDEPSADDGAAVDSPLAAESAPPVDDEFGDGGDPDPAQAEADEKARIAQEEEEEMFILRSKKKPKKADRDRMKVLEGNAEQRAREAEELAAANEEQAVPEVINSTDAPVDDLPAETDDAAQAEADEKAKVIQMEEEELAQLRDKKKPKKADRDRIRILEERADARAREAEEVAAAAAAATALDQSLQESSGDTAGSKTDETAPTSLDAFIEDDGAAQAEKDDAARLIEEEEIELELLLSKSKLKKADKARLKELQDNKEQREQEAAAKLEAEAPLDVGADAADDPPAEVAVAGDTEDGATRKSEEVDLAAKLIEAEELELEHLLSKSKLKKSEKARLKELKDNKEQREQEATGQAEAAADPPVDDVPLDDAPSPPSWEADPVDEAALQKEAEVALIAAEESELSDLLAKSKLKKADKARLKELQDRKDERDEKARAAAAKAEEEEHLAKEKAEQEARELEEQQKREEEERRAVEIEAEEAEISSLKSKKKLKKPEKERLAELELRRDERASAEAARLAEGLLQEDAENDANKQNDPQPLSWADDDPATNNGAGDDWLDWGVSGSKKSKKSKEEPVPDTLAAAPEPEKKRDDIWSAWDTGKKDKKKKGKSSNLIDFGGAEDPPAVPDPPPAVPEVTGFDFGWGKQSSKTTEPATNDIWSFGGSSKKKSKDAPVEVVDDTMVATPIDEVKDKIADDDFWSTFGGAKSSKDKKSNSKDDRASGTLPSRTDSKETDEDNGGNVWDDPSGSTELSNAKSKSSDKDSMKKSSKEPKLSKKELEKLEKEKKRAEKEQKAREDQEAKELAENARIEEEARLAAEAKAEEERLAQEEADRIQKEEEEKQAALDAIAQEETDLAALQAKKDSGKKLTKKDKEKYDKLSASCQARADEKAAQEAAEQAAREEAERLQREAEEQAQKEAIEKEEAELKDLQRKKDSGRKLLKKDKEKYDLLSANKKARRQAEKDAEAAREQPVLAEDIKMDDDLEKDLATLDANELDELDKFLSEPAPPAATKKEAEVDPFSFWGASKKTTSSKKGKSSEAKPVSKCNPPAYPKHQLLCWHSSLLAFLSIGISRDCAC